MQGNRHAWHRLLVGKCTQVPTGSAKRIDTMLPAAHTDNLSVVMVRPIPWYGSSAVRHLNPVGEQARGVSKRRFPWIPSKIKMEEVAKGDKARLFAYQ